MALSVWPVCCEGVVGGRCGGNGAVLWQFTRCLRQRPRKAADARGYAAPPSVHYVDRLQNTLKILQQIKDNPVFLSI